MTRTPVVSRSNSSVVKSGFKKKWLLAFLSCVFVTSAGNAEPVKVLFLGDNGSHRPKSRFAELEPVLRQRGIELTYTEDTSVLELQRLKRYDALAVYANIDAIEQTKADQHNRCFNKLLLSNGQ